MTYKQVKKKTTFTFTEELLDTVQCISSINNKRKNEVIEDAFWEWWSVQEEQEKYKVQEMKKLIK